MNEELKNPSRALLEGVDVLIQQGLRGIRQDITIDAEIKKVQNSKNGEYKVEYQGSLFSAFSQSPLTVYNIGDRVYVLVPEGDYSKKKIILGRSSYADDMSVKERQNLQNYYIDQGPNWAQTYKATNDLDICACPEARKGELISPAKYACYDIERSGNNNDDLRGNQGMSPEMNSEVDRQMGLYSEFYNYIKISADFTTSFTKTHLNGEYYLEVVLQFKNPKYQTDVKEGEVDNEPYIRVPYRLGFDSFIGSPYGSVIKQRQSAYFELPPNTNVYGIYSIGLLQDGKFDFDNLISYNAAGGVYEETEEIKDRNNISCSDIEICFCEKVNLGDNLYHPWIEAPKGIYLYDPQTLEEVGVPAIELIAHLQFGDLDLTTQDNCEIHWFRQKADATRDLVDRSKKDIYGKTYYDYCGNGWWPIDEIEYDKDTGNVIYRVEDNVLTIYKEAVTFRYKYMAVISVLESEQVAGANGQVVTAYKELNLQKVTQDVYRFDTKYDLAIELKDRGDSGESANYHVVDRNDKREKPWEWFGIWFIGRPDGSYERIKDPEDEKKGITIHKGPIDLSFYLTTASADIFVMAFDPYDVSETYDGEAVPERAQEVGILTFRIESAKIQESYLTWEGTDSFFYDANGGRNDNMDDKEYYLKPIVHFPEGQDTHYKLEISFAPTGVKLNSRESQVQQDWADSYGYYSPQGYLLKNMYVENNIIHFHVADTFKLEQSRNNIFKVKLIPIGEDERDFYKEVIFAKDGSQGSIGNEWHARIQPCNFLAQSKEALFTERVPESDPYPLVVRKVIEDPTTGKFHYEQDLRFRVFLRPFVTKDNVPLESLDPQEGYYYRCSWDVRHPGAAVDTVKGSSFLRLWHTRRYDNPGEVPMPTTEPLDPTDPDSTFTKMFDCTNGGKWETGGPKAGLLYEDIKVNKAERMPNGLVGYTTYPLSAEFPSVADEYETYGAVEVRFFDNAKDGTGATLEDSRYRFIVKCQVDIMRGQWSADKKKSEIVQEGNNALVASIITYYPIDVFFNGVDGTELNVDFNFGKNISTNWPKYVEYNAAGSVPQHSATEKLTFLYKESDYNYEPYNCTEATQSFVQEVEKDDTGTIVNIDYFYSPNPHLNMLSGFHGAIRTKPGGVFGENFFVRNQVMYLNLYGNVAVNGWDGVGLDTNDEEGTILGAMFGAGYKRPSTNAFTGVLMGRNSAHDRRELEGYQGAAVDEEAKREMPYLTGIFGYQDGMESFGLLENGTAFFGRANGGGRIILDGTNGVIYGGANGEFKSPSIGDPMWNQLRINLIDLTHQAQNGDITKPGEPVYYLGKNINEEISFTETKGIKLGFKGHFFGYGGDTDHQYSVPEWYANQWRTGYLKPDGDLPYYLQKKTNGDYKTYEDLPFYNGEDIGSLAKSGENYRIDYYDSNWITIQYYRRDDTTGEIVDPRDIIIYKIPATATTPEKVNFTWDEIYNDSPEVAGGTGGDLWKAYVQMVDDGIPFSLSSYGQQRASTTPAIEIGQHPHGLMPGLIPTSDYMKVMQDLSIPGDRNFMVTYDGTLWAMNAVICGNIIGSNILGGKVMGAEIIAGVPDDHQLTDNHNMYVNKYLCDWLNLIPPKQDPIPLKDLIKDGVKAGIDEKGVGRFENIQIFGGSIDLGSFHIFGRGSAEIIKKITGKDVTQDWEYLGHLVQTGKSDFIGETHFYGNVLLGPNENWQDDKIDGGPKKVQKGILAQTGSLTLLGILENSTFLDGHQFVYNKIMSNNPNDVSADTTYYAGDQSGFLDLVAQIGKKPESYETASMFGLLAVGDPKAVGFTSKAHLWPLHFKGQRVKYTDSEGKTVEGFKSYVTVMNQFKYNGIPVASPPNPQDTFTGANTGTNYFRISPWGTENINTFIRSQFQDEQDSAQPLPDQYSGDATTNRDVNPDIHTYRGYFGLVKRAGEVWGDASNVDRGAIGITSWNHNAVIIHSDDTSAWRSRNQLYFVGGNRNKDYPGPTDTTTIAERWGDDDKQFGTVLFLGGCDAPTLKSQATYAKINSTRVILGSAGGRLVNVVYSEEQRTAPGGVKEDFGEMTLCGRFSSDNTIQDPNINKSPACMILQPYSNGGEGNCNDVSAKLWCWPGKTNNLGGVHIYCQKKGIWENSLPCDQAQQSELFITDRKIGMMCQDRVVVGTFAQSAIVGDAQAGTNVHRVLANVKDGFGSGMIVDRVTYGIPRTYLIGGEVHAISDVGGEHGPSTELFLSNKNATLSGRNVYLKSSHGDPHSGPGKGIAIEENQIRFIDYSAEQQIGIYARFA